MKRPFPHLLLALALVLLAGCSSSSSGTGSAQFAVSVPQALNASISRLSVTATAPDFSSVSVDLVSSNGVWGGTLGNIPAGPSRSFLAQAFDASGTRLFEGSASGVSITANQTSLVAITLQQVNAPPPLQHEAPIIDSLTAPATSVAAGGSLSLVATAHDPNPGDTLSYVWSSTAGTFSSASSASTTWTAPASTGIQTLTFTVTDSQGLSSSLFLAVYVLPSEAQGTAQITISFNTAPRVVSVSAIASQLAVGQTTSVSASASDADGDSLFYSWSTLCAGSWAQAASSSAQFTPSTLPTGECNNCELTVTVSDGRGGQSTGTVALCVSAPPAPQHFHPLIVSASGSSLTASPGQVITYEVAASDPEGSALSFSWAVNAGSLGTPVTGASSSRATWTAPSCVDAGTSLTLTATVTNAFNLSTTQSFSVIGLLPVCGWAPAGSMSSVRNSHTATLLPDGKVLVAGGTTGTSSPATAELYDPATGTWSATGTMLAPRGNATATLLLNGKVLVTGASGKDIEEVYDPATGTWSATSGLLTIRYFSSATRLLDGKVLIAGGYQGGPGDPSVSEVYDPATGTWSASGTIPVPGHHTATRLPDGKVLVAGGESGGAAAAANVYDPATGIWSATAPLLFPRFLHRATPLPNGKVLLSGGVHYNGFTTTAEVYDPATGTWSAAGSMLSAHYQHTATLLPNGKVLVTGGYSWNGITAEAELYDPATDTWSAAAPMASPRQHHTATLLPNGKVLITGGASTGGSLATAELYTP
ncbi:MAG TPA: kelch repeat-containing protein [Myxococcaceae bacterium]